MTSSSSASEVDEGSEELGSDGSFLRAVAGAPDLPAAAIEPERAGTSIGKYRVIDKLGAGGMGIVYRARDERLDRVVALKVLRARSDVSADHRKRFAREARAASAVRHPNVATVFEVGEDGDTTFLAMELVPGESLRQRLQAGPIPSAEATRIAIEIARGLAAAHARGLVHRDLKPDNVMLEPDGRVKVLDFGLARWIAPEEAEAPVSEALTAEGHILGTAGYMSPEQVSGRAVERPSDVFSLGIVCFEMLTGERPFRGETRMDALVATSRDEVPRTLERRSDVPPAFARLVRAMLAKDPAARPGPIDELIRELERVASLSTRSWSRRPVALLLGGVLVLAALVAIPFALPRQDAGDGRARSSEPAIGPDVAPPSEPSLPALPAVDRSAAPLTSAPAPEAGSTSIASAVTTASASSSASPRPVRSAKNPAVSASAAPRSTRPDPLGDQK